MKSSKNPSLHREDPSQGPHRDPLVDLPRACVLVLKPLTKLASEDRAVQPFAFAQAVLIGPGSVVLMELVCSGPSIGLDGAGVLEEAIQRVRVPLVLTGSLEHHVWRVESPLLPQETASNGPRSPLSEYPIARWTKVMTSASAANTSPRKRSQRGQRAFGSKGTATLIVIRSSP